VVYRLALSVSEMAGWCMNDELEGILKVSVVA
jgi:hypothetical protein